jgi:hypothetical protein
MDAVQDAWLHGATTENVSGGGMYVRTGSQQVPKVGHTCEFQLFVGPEAGYSPTDTRIAGWAQVVRVESPSARDAGLGVGMLFQQPLAVGF